MENLLKGWVLSLMGFIGIVAIAAHSTGFFVFPNPDILDNTYEAVIGLIVCFSLLLFPKTKIEALIESMMGVVVNIFTKKKDEPKA